MKDNKKDASPNTKEKEVYDKLFLEIFEQVVKAKKGHRYMEAYILGWTVVEQFMVPDLIKFVSGRLKFKVQENLSELQASQLFKLYYFLSHDKELFDALEQGRKTRNKLTHSLYKHKNWVEVKDGFKDGLNKQIVPLTKLILKRYQGETSIPVLQLYSKGWEDCRKEILKELKGMHDDLDID
jgi:hypothetical protein